MRRCPVSALLALALMLPLPARAAEGTAAGPEVNFNFEQVEIRLLVKLVGDMTGRRFVVDESVSGKVTVVTPHRIPVPEAYPLLVSILESSGYSVVEKDGAHHVVRLADRTVTPAPVVTDAGTNAVGLITKVIRITHVSAVEVRKLLEPLVRGGKAGAVAAFPPTNHLIITDTAENIREMEKIIAELDRPGASRMVEVVQVRHGSAEDMAREIVAAMKGAASSGDRVARHLQQVGEGLASLPSDVVVVPSAQANSLVLVGTPVQLRELREVVAKMDVEAPSGYGRLHSIFLRYLKAEDAAKSLNALLAKTVEKDQRAAISIEHNAANNALIVDAAPQDFEYLRKLVDDLDRIPQQVMVEVMIAEIAEGKKLDLGVQLTSIETPRRGTTTVVGRSRPGQSDILMDAVEQGVFPQGIAIGIARGTYTDASGNVLPSVPLVVQALAENQDVKILSNPTLWAQNNSEATVSVVENIPILRSTIEGGSGTSRDVIQNIDRIDVGIKLKVTPHVNPEGEVTMLLNPSIEAITDSGSSDVAFTPTISKREVSTTVTVPDRSTVVISGLIREDVVKQAWKVPLLGDIPLLGWFFRSKSDSTRRTNLLIFVTPHIVTDMDVASQLQKSLQQRAAIDTPAALESAPAPAGK